MKSRLRKSDLFAVFVTGISLSGMFIVSVANGSDSISTLEQQQADAAQARKLQLEEFNAKIKAYQAIIDLKKAQGATLSDQIATLDAQTSKLKLEIDRVQQELTDVSSQLSDTNTRIIEKERTIAQERRVLSRLVQELYSDTDDGTGILLAATGNESDLLMKREDWMSETNARVVQILRDMAATKKSLEADQTSLTGKKIEVDSLRGQLSQKNDDLEKAQQTKASLLLKTQSDQAKYEDMLQNVMEQKAELLDFSATSNLASVFGSVGTYPKPDKKYQASTSWYYSQRDPRWANEEIGRTKSKMQYWGCAVSSVAMVFTKLGFTVSPGTLANKNSLFEKDLIIWPDTWSSGSIDISSSTSHGNVDWSTIDSTIGQGFPVIVHIARNRGGGHYVVIHNKDSKGRYVVHDPYFGANLFLSTSMALVGQLGSTSATSVDQMIIYKR
ncbi:MAG TPA: C39 family peptidase [Candidatus Fimivivens sp.]|nr:C39 family peptidase [Candidatus Fimivivens sp.]